MWCKNYFEADFMKEINIIGIGMSKKTLTQEALKLIEEADILIGAKRLVDEFSAWKIKTIVANTAVAAGPNNAALNPLPVGWEQLPVTEGNFNDERTNINAPLTASKALDSGNSSTTFLIL